MLSETQFSFLIGFIAVSLYISTLHCGFTWDDRAAVVKNPDVLGLTSITNMFFHDFWGQNITLKDSHKSFRPITVLSYRLNYNFGSLNPLGYHLFNVFIFATVSALFYSVSKQLVSPLGARIAVLLFVFHPIHVEAVASIVGRADLLCAAWFLSSILCYQRMHSLVTTDSYLSNVKVLGFFVLSLGCALAASLSKETGVTVYPILIAVEFIESLKLTMQKSKHFRYCSVVTGVGCSSSSSSSSSNNNFSNSKRTVSQASSQTVSPVRGYLVKNSFTIGINMVFRAMTRLITDMSAMVRISVLTISVVVFMKIRLDLNGEQQLYSWTMMENHISLLPNAYHRLLSYAQTHFWYFFKLVYPRHLCFDYGYACIPVISSAFDIRNILPIMAYSVILYLGYKGVRDVNIGIIFGLGLMVASILPALNIFIPVGTTLAERVLFLPSAGYCIVLGEILTMDVEPICFGFIFLSSFTTLWRTAACSVSSNIIIAVNWFAPRIQTENSKRKHQKQKLLVHQALIDEGEVRVNMVNCGNGYRVRCIYILLVPFMILSTYRILMRNRDWGDEFQLFSSALTVCPTSVKALTNYAVLAAGKGLLDESLAAATKAVDLYSDYVPSLVNAGLTHHKLGHFAESVYMMQRGVGIEPENAKAHAYLGRVLYDWFTVQQALSHSSEVQQATITTTSDATYHSLVPSKEAAALLLKQAVVHLKNAENLGYSPPANLHLCGSAYFDMGDLVTSVYYYEAALNASLQLKALVEESRSAFVADDIDIIHTYNQLGTVHWKLNNHAIALKMFEDGLRINPSFIPILNNIGNLYGELGMLQEARKYMQQGIESENGQSSVAIINNFGLLELQEGNFTGALHLFKLALQILRSNIGDASKLEIYAKEAEGPDAIIIDNIRRAEAALLLPSATSQS